jgi:hypothetical protein
MGVVEMGSMTAARGYSALVGVALVVTGLLGFVGNPLVGDAKPGGDPLFVTGTVHNLVHLLTGALALYIAFGLKGESQSMGVVGFGVLYLVILVLTIINGNLFGILNYPVNGLDHVLHLAVGVASIGVGVMGRSQMSIRR